MPESRRRAADCYSVLETCSSCCDLYNRESNVYQSDIMHILYMYIH